MSVGESVLLVIERVESLCKERHASLREACVFVREKAHERKCESHNANLLFYPLLIASKVTSEKHAFLPLALKGIALLIKHRLVPEDALYAAPVVPIPVPRKGFFSTTDITRRSVLNDVLVDNHSYSQETQEKLQEQKSQQRLIDVIIEVLKEHRRCGVDGVSLLVLHSFDLIISEFESVSGEQLIDCFQSAFDARLEVRPFSGSGVSESLRLQMITTILGRHNVIRALKWNEGMVEDDGNTERYNRDCQALLVRICDLSIYPVDIHRKVDSIEWRMKKLSCVLLAHFFNEINDHFSTSIYFRAVLHEHVMGSLLRNCSIGNPDLHRVALGTLYRIILNHRPLLKSKVAVFLLGVLLPLLESKSVSFTHKGAILEFFELTLREPFVLAEWFANFDCVQGMPNLCELLASRLSKLTKMSYDSQRVNAKQDSIFRVEVIKVLCTFVRSLEVISREFDVQSHEHDRLEDSEKPPESRFTGDEEREKGFSPSHNSCIVDTGIEQLIRGKRTFDAVVDLFNTGESEAAVRMAVEFGFANSSEPSDVARFLLRQELDPVSVGLYLTKNTDDRKSILQAFIRLTDFTGLAIDEAMRLFLGKFKLPGEAQVVDRAMEVFAEQYCSQNPKAFSSPSPAFILAFSIMMLNTDAHSSHIVDKMSLIQFIRNNSGIDDGRDLPQSLLEGIYHRVTVNEIVLERRATLSRGSIKRNIGGYGGFTRKLSRRQETEELVETSLTQITQDVSSESYTSVSAAEIAGAVLSSTWTPLLAAFSVRMEEKDNMDIIDVCIEGLECAVRVCCRFACRTERNAFVSAISAFTDLTSFREIEYKSVKAIVSLIRIALEEGDHLETSWHEIIRGISLLDKLQILTRPSTAASATEYSGKLRNTPRNTNNNSNIFSDSYLIVTDSMRNVFMRRGESGFRICGGNDTQPIQGRMRLGPQNAETIAKYIDDVQLHSLFSRSGNLKDTAVVDLVEALCLISVVELAEVPPRTFCLEKLLEVTEANIWRLRYVWSKMWSHVSRHLVFVALNSSQAVAMFAVDHLRQLAMKFLARDELGNFNFQKDILKPFEAISARSCISELKELIVASLGHMVEARADHLRSGWNTLIGALAHCARNEVDASIIRRVALVLQHVTLHYLGLLTTIRDLTDLVNAWTVVGHSTVDTTTAQSAVWYVYFVAATSAVDGRYCSSPIRQPETFTTEIDAGGNIVCPVIVGLQRNVKESPFCLSVEEIRALARSRLDHKAIIPPTCEVEVGVGIEGKVEKEAKGENSEEELLCLSAIGSLASLVMSPSVSGDAIDASLEILSGPARHCLSTSGWWQATGGAVVPTLYFLAQQCSRREMQSQWIPILEKAVAAMVQLEACVVAEGLPVAMDRVLFLLQSVVVSVSFIGYHRTAEIGYRGARLMLQGLDDCKITDKEIWDPVVICVKKIGNTHIKALKSVCLSQQGFLTPKRQTVTPLLLTLIAHVKWMRDIGLMTSVATDCRVILVDMMLEMLSKVMFILRGSVDWISTDNENGAFCLAVFVTLERSLCQAFFDVTGRYPTETLLECGNVLWILVIKQFIAVSTGKSDANCQEATSLRVLLGQFLNDMLQAPKDEMLPRVKSCMPQLCGLITVNDADLAAPLGALFLRYHTEVLKEHIL